MPKCVDTPREFATVEACVDQVIARAAKRIVLGAPLGIGKPNRLINAFFRRAEDARPHDPNS